MNIFFLFLLFFLIKLEAVDEKMAIQQLSDLKMAKIALDENRMLESRELLNKLKAASNDLFPAALKFEWLYTEGQWHFKQKNFDASIQWLKKALPKRNSLLAPWKSKTELLLALAYLQKGKNSPLKEEKQEAFSQAANYLSALIKENKAYTPLYGIALSLEGSNASLIELQHILETEAFTSPEKTLLQAVNWEKQGKIKDALNFLEKEKLPPPFHEEQLFLLGSLLYKEGKFASAKETFQTLIASYPDSSLIPPALYWTGRSEEALGGSSEKSRPFYETLVRDFPKHPLAPDAYFYFFSPQDYLTGDRKAIKHLHAFKNKFPASPLLLHALYLEGLDYLHDRRSPEGKWISRQNLMAAIDAFHDIEILFDTFHQKQPLNHLVFLRYQAILERAKTNLKVAKLAKGAKKAIYLDYAHEVFQSLVHDFNQPAHPLIRIIQKEDLFHPIHEEALFHLILTESLSNKSKEALANLQILFAQYDTRGIKQGHYLALAFYQQGLLLTGQKRPLEALDFFDKALAASLPSYLSHEEILHILIAKAESYRLAGEFDNAMSQLSEVVNFHTASSLRLKAMYLRAHIYEEQGRKHLAQKQLESIALKNGEWALKAQEHLEKHYGFD